MAWYHMTGQDQDVVLSTRVRLFRNLNGYPFTHRLDATGAKEIIASVGEILKENGFCKLDFADISRAEAYSLVERQYASLAFVKKSLPHVLYLNEPCSMSVMLCEEEHISLQCIRAGHALDEAYTSVSHVEEQLDERLDMAFSEGVGYLSSAPMHVGNGLQISVLLCLPGMAAAGRIERLTETLADVDIGLRAVMDSTRHTVGNLFHMTYCPPSGQGEGGALSMIEDTLSYVLSEERALRAAGTPTDAECRADRIMRAMGALRHALLLDTSETMDLLSEVRLGIAMGIVPDVRMETLTALVIETLPATLSLATTSQQKTPHADAAARASYVRERLLESATVPEATAQVQFQS